jgi:UDP-N-acetyl-D-glucosamine dehydrogenase
VKRTLGHSFRFVELANDVNDHMPDYVVRRLMVALNRERQALNGAHILLLGLAYKRNTGDARESPAMVVAERLLDHGADVYAADPHVLAEQVDGRITLVEATASALQQADAVVVLTDHDAFDFDLVAEHARFVFDTRRRLPSSERVEYL